MTSYLLERAWVDGAVRDDVLVEIADGRFTRVTSVPPDGASLNLSGRTSPDMFRNPRLTGDSSRATRLPGLTLPGLADTHSHAFHRALRGRTQVGRGTFWTWREQMYDLAGRLDPDGCLALARGVYREMVAAGITSVGEFHYLHHQRDGTPYDDANAMGHALLAAGAEAGVRVALIDACYLSSGFGAPVDGVQRRFSDGTVAAWAERVAHGPAAGVAVHSVRAVPDDALATVVEAAAGRPLHVHLSEQVAENDDCVAAYGATPTQLLADHGVLGPLTTAVHATHLTPDDVAHLGAARAFAAFCPTTERDLGDGVGPSRALHDAGARLTLGSDSHAVIDPFEEMRAVELDERLTRRTRGHWSAAELLDAATVAGHASLGLPDAGAIAVGRRADLVTIDTATPRTAGTGADEHTAVFAASAADVVHVVVEGRRIDLDPAGVGRELDETIARLWR